MSKTEELSAEPKAIIDFIKVNHPEVWKSEDHPISDVINIALAYASIKCKEQREICVMEWLKALDSEDEEDAIRNAPSPK